ncbi:MAG: RagB/SusD family nutrient uptake outer membrane protein, partial [Flavitalea sp.]
MMRSNIQYSGSSRRSWPVYPGMATLLFIAIFLLPGCNKYLDKEPDNRTVITTPEQIAQLLTSAYPHANYILFCEAMSDNAEDKEGSGSQYSSLNKANQQSYKYEVVEISPDDQDGPDNYWVYCYKAIAAANQALEIIAKSPYPSKLSAHKGEALVARAYAHFMLVTLFAKAYDPATAASDPGIPYVTEPEKQIFKQYDRSTVANVYELIEKDLLEGYPLIDDKIYNEAPKFHFNKKAAAAFAARFYLFKQDYGSTITYSSQALSATPANDIRPWNTILTNLPYNELETDYAKATTRGNLLLQEADSFWGDAYPSLRYGIGEQVAVELLFNRNVTGGTYTYDLYGSSPRSYNIPKFYTHVVATSINANSGQPFNTIPLFTAEEALLNRAEAYVRSGNANLAIKDLNAFAS